jgi:hypothetical protein
MKKLLLIFILLPTFTFADNLIHSERLTVYVCNSYEDAKLCESNCEKTNFEHEIFITKNGNDEDYDVKNYENGKCVDCKLGNNYKKVDKRKCTFNSESDWYCDKYEQYPDKKTEPKRFITKAGSHAYTEFRIVDMKSGGICLK